MSVTGKLSSKLTAPLPKGKQAGLGDKAQNELRTARYALLPPEHNLTPATPRGAPPTSHSPSASVPSPASTPDVDLEKAQSGGRDKDLSNKGNNPIEP